MSHDASRQGRRRFLGTASGVVMAGGLIGGYGTFLGYAGRFLYPVGGEPLGWLYVAEAARIAPGASLTYRTPAGATVVIARQGSTGEAADFLALSSTCPHLGCQVHWESQNNRFFCPCHNGVFDPSGKGIGGPPGDAGQSLPRYPLRIERGLLYIEVPLRTLADAGEGGGGLTRPGHDACLKGLA
ncbi:MAG: ubiquinol-cytochrome c reductase iron-sulfur subunit [Planctomycetaceae bacterium]